MNLKEHYSLLYKESINKIASDTYKIDHLIDSETDKRFGITVVIRPSAAVKENIQKFLDELKKIEPDQYYYPSSDIHITVMSIISCYEGFDIDKIDLSKYIDLIQKSLITNTTIDIQFKGLTASDSCIMVQGFMNNNCINEIRDNLRTAFKKSNLEQSLDKRYSIQTAHSTVVRFRDKFKEKDAFLEIIDKYKDFDFGSFSVNNFELVYNDWYQRDRFVKKLHNFEV
ncbi:2'-5' RNA ligase family protein [Flavobacterium sp. WC2509]|uniref:2'-5' RNA ligase family protein n=1 Tax=Flavobacterium sp. WC2509 TaxID=3461406 RepID=UPI004044A106